MELYKKYRPKTLNELVGQKEAVKTLQKFIDTKKIPHFLLLSGDSGCGKTTIARILQTELNCVGNDFIEINGADTNGVEVARDIRKNMTFSPAFGSCKIFYLDEVQRLTSAAQGALLKILEDTPRHVYFIFSTTDPQKLSKAVRSRATELKVRGVTDKEMTKLLCSILKSEDKKISEDVIDKIVSAADGGIRKALVILNQIIDLEDEEEQSKGIEGSQAEMRGFELARLLCSPRKPSWKQVQAVLSNVTDEPETIRYIVLGYANSVMLKNTNTAMLENCFNVIDIFKDSFMYTSKAGLTAACYEIVTGD